MKKCMLIGLAVLFVGSQAIARDSQKDTKRTKRDLATECPYCFGETPEAKASTAACTCDPGCPCTIKKCHCCVEDCYCCKKATKATRNPRTAKNVPEETIITVKEGEEFDLQMPHKPGHNWRILEGRDPAKKLKDHVSISKPKIVTTPEGEYMAVWTLTPKKIGNPLFSMRLVPEGSKKAVEIKKYAIVIEPK